MSGLIVSHPHAAAVATEIAVGLEGKRMLSAYYTGIAASPGTMRYALLERLARERPQLRNRLLGDLRPSSLRAFWSVEAVSRVAAGMMKRRPYDAVFSMHDAAVASVPWPSEARAVYAFEDAAVRTFRAAAKRNIARIWDLPLPHWATLEHMWQEESAKWPNAMGTAAPVEPPWKKARKDEELHLADVVSVASKFTRDSLESAGCKKAIVDLPYGFPTDQFQARHVKPHGPFTVLAVGTHDLRKGTPYLLEAWRRADLQRAKLRLIGPLRLTDAFLATYRGLFEHVAHVPRALLQQEYSNADLLAFPTLGDGFGLVILEAMSCGTPVLTTRCGGGPECITHGRDGWLVAERDVEALVDVIRWAASERDRVWDVGVAARARAEKWSTIKYRAAIVDVLRPFTRG